jgi:hypothetical protein
MPLIKEEIIMMKEMKHKMMSRMMTSMMGEGHNPMKIMMKMMEKNNQSAERGDMPWDMCQNMMTSFREKAEATKFATPELHRLFEEWVEQIEEEIVQFVDKAGNVDPEAIAEHFKLSKESVVFLLTRLAKKGKFQFTIRDTDAEGNEGS